MKKLTKLMKESHQDSLTQGCVYCELSVICAYDEVDKADDEGVPPRLLPGHHPGVMQALFSAIEFLEL